MTAAGWPRYLAGFHDEKAGITERVLGRLDSSPYEWLAEPLTGTTGWIVDLACGSAPTRDHLRDRQWLGIDLSAAELAIAAATGRRPVAQADANVLPIADGAGAAVCAAMALQVVTPLDEALAEAKRVLRPDGLLVALVPSRLGFPPRGWVRWLRLFRALGISRLPWPNPRACDDLPVVLAERGFKIVSNQRRTFWFSMDTPDAAALLVDSLYLPGVSAEHHAAAVRTMADLAPPRRRLPVPLRRVVVRR